MQSFLHIRVEISEPRLCNAVLFTAYILVCNLSFNKYFVHEEQNFLAAPAIRMQLLLTIYILKISISTSRYLIPTPSKQNIMKPSCSCT